MAEDTKKKDSVPGGANLPSLPPKPPASTLAYSRYVQEAPYRALIGVVVDGREPHKLKELPRDRVRRQTGLTNRWRMPDSLYSDMLGTTQALKAINMPFNQVLAHQITGMYPTCNRNLMYCKDFAFMNERQWSLLKKTSKPITKAEDAEVQSMGTSRSFPGS